MVQYVLMTQKTTVNKATKDILARCMATEDIIVEHRADVPSAYFDTKNRVLCLPVWKDMDNSVYDMLVGHEVSHALHTPCEGWQEFVGKGKGSGMRHMFLNIVEDARIERMIKDKFPGLRRDFASAYRTLHTQDLFELDGRTIKVTDELIDRLNLHFKLGLFGLENIPFASNEKQYVTRMGETETFEDVMELARELYEKHVDELEDEEEENGEPQPQSGEEGEGEQNPFGDTPEDDEESGASQSTDGTGDDDAESQDGEDSGQSQDDDTDDGESADSEKGEGSESGDEPSDLAYEDYENNVNAAGSSQRNFEQAVEDMTDSTIGETQYHTLPNLNLDNIIVDYSVIGEMWSKLATTEKYNAERLSERRQERYSELNTFLNKAKPTVMHMVQQFQMKQAADADKRTNVTKTGVLDTTSMINYRWSEDIFLKNETHADGKNHGIVMFIDWSGSMGGILQDTVEQLVILTEFCNKVNIPFEVYAFSSSMHIPDFDELDRYSEEWRDAYREWEKSHPTYTIVNEDTDVRPHTFQLYNFLSSRMKTKEYKTALRNLWVLTSCCANYGSRSEHPSCLQLGCTPLNESIVAAMDIVPEFQRQNGLQIVNTVFLTDGDGHSMGIQRGWSSRKEQSYVRDHKTRKTYTVNEGSKPETNVLLRILKDKTGCNTIGIRLHASKHIRGFRYNDGVDDASMTALANQWKKNNFITLKSAYDKYFIVQGQLKVEFDALEELDEDASLAKIKNAFLKGSTSKKSSRVIASQLIEIIAT
jgi:cobalamin biosynthesis protein CobT